MMFIRFDPASCNFLSSQISYSSASSQAYSFCNLNASTSNFQFSSNCSLLFIYYKMSKPYLQTLRDLQIENDYLKEKINGYSTYEDYLHQRSRLRSNSYVHDNNLEIISPPIRRESYQLPNNRVQSKIAYYPVQRKQIEYQNNQIIEKIPKTKKIVEYRQHKQIQMVPKEVIKTDYYAVEHLKHYVKQTVPEIKIETVKVPKIIKNVQTIPVQKQVIFYPSYLTDMNQIKQQARSVLLKQGVLVREDAEYRPIFEKRSLSPAVRSTQVSQVLRSTSPHWKTVIRDGIAEGSSKYYYPAFSPPLHYLNNSMIHSKTAVSSIPFYQKEKYDFKRRLGQHSLSHEFEGTLQPSDYTFAQKDRYRYDLAMHKTNGRLGNW